MPLPRFPHAARSARLNFSETSEKDVARAQLLPLSVLRHKPCKTGSHINDIHILRVYHHPFPITTPILVATHRKRHINTSKGSATIIRTEYGPIRATGIRTAGNIHVLWILRVNSNALPPLQIAFIQTYPVQQGHPLAGNSIPPIGPFHIGTLFHS